MVRESPDDPQRAAIEIELTGALEEAGQQSINNYVRSSEKPFDADRLRRASASYERLHRLKPQDSAIESKKLFAAARVLLAEGKAKEAIDLLERSLALDSRTACPYNAMGAAYERANDDVKAAEFYTRAAAIAPLWALPRYRMGLLHYARGRMTLALREFRASAQLDPAFLSARWWLARACRAQGRLAEAEREALELIRIASDYAPAHLELGLIYEAKREWDRAGKAFETYLRLNSLATKVSKGL
jgi:tetratricopeptide (TPR) repeat protein